MTTPNYITDFENWLATFINYEKLPDKAMFKLDTMRNLCALFDHPEQSYKILHVAGSKGKGSVSRMLSSVLAASGKEVGVFASPHVFDFRERVSGARGFFSDRVYQNAIKELTVTVDDLRQNRPAEYNEKFAHVTWFELVTIFAFLTFHEAKVDYAVLEVGMGGRLDATNVITPELSIITSIELEHTEILGDTLEKIAAEKAGIIKPNVPVVVAKNTPSVNQVFAKTAEKNNSKIYFVDQLTEINTTAPNISNNFSAPIETVEIKSKLFQKPLNINLKMLGEVQAKNAAEAALALKVLDSNFSEDKIRAGLENATLPGRFEIRNYSPSLKTTLILDGAHTVESIQGTIKTFNGLYKNRPANLLFALAKGKDYDHIAPLLKDRFDHIYLTRPGDFKASDLPALESAFKNADLNFVASPDFKTTIKTALAESLKENKILLVTGSFYLLAEVNKIIEATSPPSTMTTLRSL